MQAAIKESEELIQWMDTKIHDLSFLSTDRYRLAAGCFDMASEHHKAIVLLTANSRYGSAAALIRLQFESYVRGVWLLFCATEVQLNQFMEDKLNRNFGQMIEDIERLGGYSSGTLSYVKEKSWATMNSFTHSGFYQVVRRNMSSKICPNYAESEILDALSSANSFGILTAVEIANMSKNEALTLEFINRGNQYFDKAP